MPEGQIIRALSSFYYVEADGVLWECKARGVFKKRNQSPLVGDNVTFEIVDRTHGIITEIGKRKNELLRPPISNVDQAILVFASLEPEFSTLLLDKFLVHVEKASVEPIICITKLDLVTEEDQNLEVKLNIYKKIGYRVVLTDKSGLGLKELEEILRNKISVFSGQSGVGKSSLLNQLIPGISLETASISHKLGRGKHTTRETQLIHLPKGGMVADSPGFSQLDFQGIESTKLDQYFAEFNQYNDQCKFRGCLHVKEPGCAVKVAVEDGKINPSRYSHYLDFFTEIKENEERKWR